MLRPRECNEKNLFDISQPKMLHVLKGAHQVKHLLLLHNLGGVKIFFSECGHVKIFFSKCGHIAYQVKGIEK